MGTRAKELAWRFKEVMLTGQLVANTNFRDQLTKTPWELAEKQVGMANTIAAVTFHINYYVKGVSKVLNGGPLEISDRYSFDRKKIVSPADWDFLVHGFLKDAEDFYQAVSKIPDTRLNALFVDEKYGTYQKNLELMIEHCYYHLGQIVLLRKLAIGQAN